MRFAKFVLAVVAVGFTQQGCKDTTTAAPTVKSSDAVVAETTTTTTTTTNAVPHDNVENVVDTTKVVVKNNEQEDTTKVVKDNEQEDTRNVIAENSLEKQFKPMFDDVLRELVAGGDEVILTKDQLNSMRIKEEASKLAAEMGKKWSEKAEMVKETRMNVIDEHQETMRAHKVAQEKYDALQENLVTLKNKRFNFVNNFHYNHRKVQKDRRSNKRHPSVSKGQEFDNEADFYIHKQKELARIDAEIGEVVAGIRAIREAGAKFTLHPDLEAQLDKKEVSLKAKQAELMDILAQDKLDRNVKENAKKSLDALGQLGSVQSALRLVDNVRAGRK